MDRVINLERYPLTAIDGSGYTAVLDRAVAGLEENGAAVLDGFLCTGQADAAVREVSGQLDQAFYKSKRHNVYLIADDPGFAEDHPRNVKQATTSATLGYFGIPKNSILNRLYQWQPFVEFIADVLGFDRFYPYADPMSPVNVLVYREGAETGWHFDNAQFTITLLLQEPDGGAEFHYAPFIRDEAMQDHSAVERILGGESDGIHELKQSAGTLVLFRGNRTLHRVTPVQGQRERLIVVFSYSPHAGKELNEHTRQTFYGRVA